MGLLRFSHFSLCFFFLHIALFSNLCFSGDPTVYKELHVSYTTVSPLGIPQKVRSFIFSIHFILSSFFFHLGHFSIASSET
jgi:hypothetical protein